MPTKFAIAGLTEALAVEGRPIGVRVNAVSPGWVRTPMGDDSMLSYQSSSFHDAPSLRHLLRLRPLPEFEAWMEGLGLLRDGRLTEKAGDASFFLGR